MPAEQQDIIDRNQTAQAEQPDGKLIIQALELLDQNKNAVKETKDSNLPRIGICPDCNPPIDLPPDDPSPKRKPVDTKGEKHK